MVPLVNRVFRISLPTVNGAERGWTNARASTNSGLDAVPFEPEPSAGSQVLGKIEFAL